jgi:hypothetical protein
MFIAHRKPATRPSVMAYSGPTAAVESADFVVRWAAWVAEGRAHERLVKRRVAMLVGAIAVVAAGAYIFLS